MRPTVIPTPDKLRSGLLVPWFLMASYLYYHYDVSIMEDHEFDSLCSRLKSRWAFARGHQHSHLVRPEMLNQGTGYYLREQDYPLITRCAAWQLAKHLGLYSAWQIKQHKKDKGLV